MNITGPFRIIAIIDNSSKNFNQKESIFVIVDTSSDSCLPNFHLSYGSAALECEKQNKKSQTQINKKAPPENPVINLTTTPDLEIIPNDKIKDELHSLILLELQKFLLNINITKTGVLSNGKENKEDKLGN
ncbi:hypothetical protein G5574_06955 [Pantoea stewartii]|uniref:hypothetical protein n=1 Tax=Pantoea stewartii TaxID=66269 RepID=UPI0013DE1FDB|nr:hypothetical protein [Pantoea stewartii]QIE96720.1 hypothetical protein G5574_06955 [Pantoea stewartii]